MSRSANICLVILTLTLAASPLLLAEEPAAQQTLQGEVVDPASYLKDGRHGHEAEEMTYESVDGGQTLALLEDGTGLLYLFLAEQAGEDPNELVYDYVSQQVKVTGRTYERGGLRGIVPASVEPLHPPAAEPAEPPPQTGD